MTGLELLTELRKGNVSQRELARRLGISEVQISRYVRGHRTITPARAEQFRRAIHGHGEPHEELQEIAYA